MEEKKLICIGCPLGCELCAVLERGEVISVTGNTCKRGDAYARKELVSPERTVTSTVKMSDGRMLPVRREPTATPIRAPLPHLAGASSAAERIWWSKRNPA